MRSLVVIAMVALVACGGEDRPQGDCVPGSSDRLLPFDVGDSWTYEVTNITLQETTTKTQSVVRTEQYDDGMPVFVQETNKVEGRTVSAMRLVGDALVRLDQEDYDTAGLLERTTVYDPGKIRLDEAPARIAQGATFDESYTAIIYDTDGLEKSREDRVDQWEVLSTGEPCPGDFAAYDCVVVERASIGVDGSLKTFWFAAGIGKVQETGGQEERLTACSLD